MNTLVLNVESPSLLDSIVAALNSFKGVKNVKVLSDEQVENACILQACKEARKTPVVSKAEILSALV